MSGLGRALWRGLVGAYDRLVIYGGVSLLGVLCLLWTPFALVLFPFLPARAARRFARYITMAGFRFYIACLSASRRFHFDLSVLDGLRGAGPMIIAPNHPSMIDAVMIISRLPNVACVMKASLMNNFFLGAGARFARYIRNEPVRRMAYLAIQDVKGGSQLLLFPEGTRTIRAPVNQLKGSAALIACYARVPVQTVLIETDSQYLSKGWPLFRVPPMPIHYRVRLGRRFEPPPDMQAFMTELEHYFEHELVRGSAVYPPCTLPAQTDRMHHLTSSPLS